MGREPSSAANEPMAPERRFVIGFFPSIHKFPPPDSKRRRRDLFVEIRPGKYLSSVGAAYFYPAGIIGNSPAFSTPGPRSPPGHESRRDGWNQSTNFHHLIPAPSARPICRKQRQTKSPAPLGAASSEIIPNSVIFHSSCPGRSGRDFSCATASAACRASLISILAPAPNSN